MYNLFTTKSPPKQIINKIESQVNKILSDNKNNIIKIGKELLKYETINYNKIKQILPSITCI